MLYLSQVIGRPVRDRKGDPIGKVADLIVAVGDRYPPLTGLVIETDGRRIFLPWSSVESLDISGVRLGTATIDIDKFQQRPDEILLRADLLDKQIVDIDGRKVVRVNDLRLDEVDGAYHLVAVDVGAAGLLRRLGIEGGFRTIARNLKVGVPERYIDWEDVDPVENVDRLDQAARSAPGPGRAPPGRPRLDPRPARPAGPRRYPRLARRRGRR